MTRQVLVTGGFGYLGGRICRHLLNSGGYRVRITTRRSSVSEYPEWAQEAEVLSVDPLSSSDMDNACHGIDHVVHLAAMNELHSVADPIGALEANAAATVNLLRAARKAEVERLLYFSTIHIYGSPLTGSITERTLPRPTHPYAITNRTAEDFVIASHEQKHLTGIVVRLSNGTGFPTDPGIDRWTLVANDLCRQAVETGKLVLKSSGLQVRDFIGLSNMCRAVAHLLEIPRSAVGDGLFNLGGESPLSIYEMACKVATRCEVVLGFSPSIERPEPKPGESTPTIDFRIDKLKQTGFSLNADLDDEIDETLQLCQQAFQRQGI